ncbi:CRISPR-associated nuclease/helicase Cas3 [Methanobacterium congolense]|uniref:CRISPR-associated nuclease/helicase Cas3 n=2 Tax=Methanobacterium congolense TaxID=118062 RepID=A0A1D3L2S8_9EURY|nr:CRISPR-associated nuclease/helicase Cas3 [Methanobacterium congolense]
MKLVKIMLFSCELKSHPEKKLVDHLRNVAELSNKIVNSKSIDDQKIFSEITYIIGISHDFGKSTTFFQRYILDPDEKSKYTYHGFLSSFLGYYFVRSYLEGTGLWDEYWYLAPITWIVINKHHGNIENIKYTEIPKIKDHLKIETVMEQMRDVESHYLNEMKVIYDDLWNYSSITGFFDEFNFNAPVFRKGLYKDVKKLCREKNIKYYFYILFFYSVLLDADKLDASGLERVPEKVEISEGDLVDAYKSVKFKEETKINELREKAYTEVKSQLKTLNLNNDRILSINLPTGAGKTLTGFSFVLNLQNKVKDEKGFDPKIIYSLPFLSIIDQNSSIISEILDGRNKKGWNDLLKMKNEETQSLLEKTTPSNLLLKHHHLIDIKYNEERDNELNIIEDINNALLLTESWHSEIVVTTFIQFFYSIITNKNKSARKFHNITNSIIVLDEIQAIPHKYWLLINNMLKFLAYNFNCWVILMTATKPLIFEEKEIKELVENRNEYFEYFDRVDFNFDLTGTYLEDFKKNIFKTIISNEKDVMIVLNTIKSSKELYKYLKENLSEIYSVDPESILDKDGICNFGDLELINMTTHILPKYRLNRINRIKTDSKRKVIVTTQLVEAGVDISVDIIYRDLAPLDSIIQTAGRCNRNDDSGRGIVNIVKLKNNNGVPFFSHVYGKILMNATEEVIGRRSKISEKEFIKNAADSYYLLIKERGSVQDSREIVDHLKNLEFSETLKFQLIPNEGQTASIFIEIDEKAREVRENIETIQMNFKKFDKKNELLKIKRYINCFTLSIRCNKNLRDNIDGLSSIGDNTIFKYVPNNDLRKWYRLDIGFCIPETDIDNRML